MDINLPPNSCKVPTPSDLASAMVASLADTNSSTWLEPSHGDGVFIQALSRIGVSKTRITAIDLDPHVGLADSLAQTLRPTDFLAWSIDTPQRFDRIIGNPPYVSINRLSASLQQTASKIKDIDEKPIGLGSNTWYAFVLASMRLLKIGGSLAFVLPSAAEFADYSIALRTSIRKSFKSLDLYRCSRSLFDNVQEGTVVAIARGYQQSPGTFSHGLFPDRPSLISALERPGELKSRKCPRKVAKRSERTTRLDSVATIRLGGVTGDAKYFLMTEEKRKELNLPEECFTPIVSKAKHLRGASISRKEWCSLKDDGNRIWLFSPDVSFIDDIFVKNYLDLTEEQGGCRKSGFKVANRAPWYQTPLPASPDAFLSGMSQNGPLLTINQMLGLNATNTLYVVTFKSRDKNVWYGLALALLTAKTRRQIQSIARRYADGLIKYEPGSLGQIELPNLKPDSDFKALYQKAISAIQVGDIKLATEIAESVNV